MKVNCAKKKKLDSFVYMKLNSKKKKKRPVFGQNEGGKLWEIRGERQAIYAIPTATAPVPAQQEQIGEGKGKARTLIVGFLSTANNQPRV